MEDDEVMARELERLQGLQDDLFLDDVGGDKPDRRGHLKKHPGWSSSRVGKFIPLRGRGRARSRMKWVAPGRGRGQRFNKSISGGKDEDFLDMDPEDLDPNDLNVLDSWDIEQDDGEEADDFLLEEASLRLARRSRGAAARGAFAKRGIVKRGSKMPVIPRKIKASKPMLHLDELENIHDKFDIESKPRHQQGRSSYDGSWPRSGYERNRRGENVFEDDRGNQAEGYMPSRKETRREGRPASDSPSGSSGPRTKQSDIPTSEASEGIYGSGRMASQQAMRREETHLLYDSARKDSRLGPGKQRGDAPADDGEQGRRGEHRARSQSPGSRDQNRSPVHGRLHERIPRRNDLSPSPAWRSPSQRWSQSSLERRHERSLSPRERRERSLSPRHNRGRAQWDNFPREHSRGFSPRRERREYSTSPRAGRSRTPLTPPHRSSSQDDSWRMTPQTQPYAPPIQTSQQSSFNVMPPPHSQQPLYTEASVQGNYQTSAPQSSTYSAPPAAATTETSAYGMQQYNYDNYYQQAASYSRDYPPTAQPAPGWTEQRMVYPDMSQAPPVMPSGAGSQPPPPASSAPQQPAVDSKSEEAKKEAIKNEMMQQKQTLSKQREEYVCKAKIISRELQLLKEQEEDLLQEKSKDNDRILKENHKLQLEIQNKLKAINNVIDMLTGIIGDRKDVDSKSSGKSEKKRPKTPPDTPPRTSSSGSSASPDRRAVHEKSVPHGDKYDVKDTGVYNYVYYDPELHWCRVCNVFPRTAKEYLNHLHSANHKREILERKLVDFPWHKIQADQEVQHIKGARSKRTPIRGLQFFISATAWYCKLCDVWIGDLHCASLHLKSKRHAENYNQYTEKNPHWEADWLADREKAFDTKGYLKEEDQDLLPPGVEQPESKPQPMPGYKNDTFFEMRPGVKEERTHQKPKKKRKKESKKKSKSSISENKSKKKRNDFKLGQESSSSSGSSSSSSSDSSSSDSEDNNATDNGDKTKSIRVTMRNKAKVLQPGSVKAPRSKWDSPERLEEEVNIAREREAKENEEQKRIQYERMKELQKKIEREEKKPKSFGPKGGSTVEDRLLREWMTTSKDVPDGEKQLISSLKDRLKQKQEADKEREREGRRDGRSYYENKGYYDDRRDSRREKRKSESPGSSHKTKRSRGSDRHEKQDSSGRKSSPKKESSSSSKSESKVKEESRKSPEKKPESDKKSSAKLMLEAEDDSAETKFEKQAAESAKLTKKAKKNPIMSIPKSKLPFIGRMPILKAFAKKKVPEKGDGKSEEDDKKETTEDSPVLAQYRLEFTNVGGKVHIGPTSTRKSRFDQLPEGLINAPKIGPKLPPNLVKPTTLGEIHLQTPANTSQEQQQANTKQEGVQDMDIDDDTSSDPGAPVIESAAPVNVVVESEAVAEPKKQADEIPLPKDFQEALDILFPGPDGPERKEDDAAANISQSAVIESGPKPPSNMQMMQMGHPNQWGDPQMGHAQMMAHQMGGYGPQQMGPSMMGPMHGMPGPPNMQHPAHMQGPHPRMYGPGPPGMQGPPQWGPRGPSAPAGPARPPGPPRPPGVSGPPGPPGVSGNPCMHMQRSPMHSESRPPMPKEPQSPPSSGAPKIVLKKSSAGRQMSAEDLALLGIDAEDMAAQSF